MEPFGAALRPMYMDTSHVVVRPAPRFEHPGRWASACNCGESAGPADVGRSGGAPPRLRVVDAPEPLLPDAVLAAREFAIAAMTVVLEVVDRRRPVSALRNLVAGPVTDHVITRSRARYESLVAAGAGARTTPTGLRLRRVHIQLVGEGTAEFFGSYTCGQRVRAFAGRMVTEKKSGSNPRWQLQGLMLD